MNPERSVKEVIALVVARMEDWIAYGFSPMDASRIIAKIHRCDASKVMDLWLDRKVLEEQEAQLEFDFDAR